MNWKKIEIKLQKKNVKTFFFVNYINVFRNKKKKDSNKDKKK